MDQVGLVPAWHLTASQTWRTTLLLLVIPLQSLEKAQLLLRFMMDAIGVRHWHTVAELKMQCQASDVQ